jgi:hypothetical protein
MPATLWVFGGIALLVVALLAVDWFTAGRKKRRTLVRAKDQGVGNERLDYTVIERQGQNIQQQTDFPL